MRKMRMLAETLCAAALLGGLTVPAYADGYYEAVDESSAAEEIIVLRLSMIFQRLLNDNIRSMTKQQDPLFPTNILPRTPRARDRN